MFSLKQIGAISLMAASLFSINFSAEASTKPASKAPPKAPPKEKPLIVGASKTVVELGDLGAAGVAAIANINGQSVKGTYLTTVRTLGLAQTFGLVSGDMLLMINDKVAEPQLVEELLKTYSDTKATIKYARRLGTVLVVHDAPAYWVIKSADSSNLPSPGEDSLGSYAVSHAPRPKVTAEDLEDFMMQLVNNTRSMNGGLSKLKKSKTLSDMARSYAEDMSKRSYFGHKNPEGLGTKERGTAIGITNHLAENLAIARNNQEARDQVKLCQQNMMNEPPNVPGNHRSNILDPETRSIGVGIAFPSQGGVITVQEFSHDDLP